MRELDKSKRYNLEYLTGDEKEQVFNYLKEFSEWKDFNVDDFKKELHKGIYFEKEYNLWIMTNDDLNTNAKELFYTLENIQVDCRELSEEQIKEMCKVYESDGYKQWIDPEAFIIIDNFTYLRIDSENEFYITGGLDTKNTITYDKFMELFGYKEENFQKLVEVLNEELTEEVSEPQYEVTMIAEKPKHPLTPVFDKAEEISENIQNVLKAYKETSNKLNYELDFNFITQLAERMAQNKHKYEPYNWQKLDNVNELKQALFRHVLEVMKGNYEDDNRLFGHLESIALNCMFINYQLNNLNNK